jgi:hypothetical protein
LAFSVANTTTLNSNYIFFGADRAYSPAVRSFYASSNDTHFVFNPNGTSRFATVPILNVFAAQAVIYTTADGWYRKQNTTNLIASQAVTTDLNTGAPFTIASREQSATANGTLDGTTAFAAYVLTDSGEASYSALYDLYKTTLGISIGLP